MYFFTNEPNSVLGDMNTINLLLMCATHKEYEVFSKSFIFWMNLSEAVYTNSNCDKLCEKLGNFIYPLVDCITKHCQLQLSHVTSFFLIFHLILENLMRIVLKANRSTEQKRRFRRFPWESERSCLWYCFYCWSK